MTASDCETGCKSFTGNEVKHHKDCVYYPESLSKMMDDNIEHVHTLEKRNERLTHALGMITFSRGTDAASINAFNYDVAKKALEDEGVKE